MVLGIVSLSPSRMGSAGCGTADYAGMPYQACQMDHPGIQSCYPTLLIRLIQGTEFQSNGPGLVSGLLHTEGYDRQVDTSQGSVQEAIGRPDFFQFPLNATDHGSQNLIDPVEIFLVLRQRIGRYCPCSGDA